MVGNTTVTGKTSDEVDRLLENFVIGGVVASRNLYLTKADGSQVFAGIVGSLGIDDLDLFKNEFKLEIDGEYDQKLEEWADGIRLEVTNDLQITAQQIGLDIEAAKADAKATASQELNAAKAVIGQDIIDAQAAAEQAASSALSAAVSAFNSSLSSLNERVDLSIVSYETEYAVNTSETVPPTSDWSAETPTRTPGSFVWFRVRVVYANDEESTTAPALLTGNTGAPGVPGVDGEDGATTYTWVRYADDAAGTNMSDAPGTKPYIGFAFNKTTDVESTNPLDYQWSKIEGPQGSQGVPGVPGADGTPRFTWVKYADTPTTGMSDLPNGKIYIGFAYNKLTATESTNYSDYQWSLVQGPQGNQGVPGQKGDDGQSLYTWVKYADDASGAGMADVPAGKAYLGLAYNKTSPTESPDPAQYSWSKIEGPQGNQGLPGAPGADGTPRYTWLKYADTPTTGMSDSPTGKKYMGLAVNKLTSEESTNYNDYVWSLIQGPDGSDGVSVTSVQPYFQTTPSGASAPAKPTASTPPSPWTTTEPTYILNTSLWRTERIGYSDSTFSYTTVTKVAAYETALSALNSANGKSRILFGIAAPTASTPGKPGDIFWVRDETTNRITAQYLNTVGTDTTSGNTWIEQGLSHQTIATLDMGKASVGELTGEFIAADAIGAKHTLTGPLIQTVATPARGIKISSTGLLAYNDSGAETLSILSATGAISMLGELKSGSTIAGARLTGILETNELANRGIKISDNLLVGYKNTTPNQGQVMFSMDTSTGALSVLGTIKAGSVIEGGLLTGPLRTREPIPGNAARVEISNTGFVSYNTSGTPTFTINGATGAVSMLGTLESGSSIITPYLISPQIVGGTITAETVLGASATASIKTKASGQRLELRNSSPIFDAWADYISTGALVFYHSTSNNKPGHIASYQYNWLPDFFGLDIRVGNRVGGSVNLSSITLSSQGNSNIGSISMVSNDITLQSSDESSGGLYVYLSGFLDIRGNGGLIVRSGGINVIQGNLTIPSEFYSPYLPRRMATGRSSCNTRTGQQVGTAKYVAFPTGRFTSAPRVVLTAENASTPDYLVTVIGDPTTAGFTANVTRVDGQAGSVFGIDFDWIAVQES